jgi:predicted RNase H-like nuclease
MATLLVGFDSAWTGTNSGAIAGLVHRNDGIFVELGRPHNVQYSEARKLIRRWQSDAIPASTIIMLEQPTIVHNAVGQRPVENIVGSPVSLRYGGVQRANTSKAEMFGPDAPMWPFLREFGGPADPLKPTGLTWVFETYPVLAMIALEWTRLNSAGRTR